MSSIKKTIKHIRRPKSQTIILKKVYFIIGASVDDAKSLLKGNHHYTLEVLERALEIEKLRSNRTTMIQILKRAIKKAKG